MESPIRIAKAKNLVSPLGDCEVSTQNVPPSFDVPTFTATRRGTLPCGPEKTQAPCPLGLDRDPIPSKERVSRLTPLQVPHGGLVFLKAQEGVTLV